MSKHYIGGFVSKTAPSPSTSSASGIWTLDQAAKYKQQNNWPLTISDPYFSNVTLLLLANGADGSTTPIDSSSYARTVTAVGNAKLSTADKKYGTASMYFDGSGDTFTVASDPLLATGTGDYTTEFWVKMVSYSNTYTTIIGDGSMYLMFGDAGYGYKLKFGIAGYDKQYSTSITGSSFAGTGWRHIACTRSSGQGRLYIDGVQQMLANVSISASNPNPTTYPNSSVAMIENNTSSEVSISGNFNGYIDELRITKGIVRYTSNFTPPASFAI